MPACEEGCEDGEASLHFCFAASVESITPVVEAVSELARRELGEEKEMELALALQEALANAVVHGSGRDARKMVECWVALGTEGISIVVRDSGPGFSPEAVPSSTSEQQRGLDHGRGLIMIRRLMDEVHFRRNGAEIHMRKQ